MSIMLPYESIYVHSPVGNYVVSPTPEATFLAVNDTYLQYVSRTRQELIGESLFAAFPENPDDDADTGITALRDSLARVIATGQPDSLARLRYPIQITLPEGSKHYEERFWNAISTPIFDQQGQLACISHTTVDITTQVHAEKALKKSEGRYRNLFDSMREGFCIIQMLYDEHHSPIDYRFCDINPMFEQQAGLRNAVGKTIRELAPLIEPYWFEVFDKVAKSREPVQFESETKALNRWLEVNAFATDEPAAHKVAVLFKDITRYKRQEQVLRSSERYAFAAAQEAAVERRRLDAVLEAAPVGICVANASGALVKTNLQYRRLWDDRHPLPSHANDVRKWKGWWADGSEKHGQPITDAEWPLARALRGEESLHNILEIESFNAPFAHQTVLASGSPIRDDNGLTVGAVVAQMDITEWIKAEASLRETAARLQFILDSAQIGEWDLDLANNTAYRSLRHDQCFGYSEPIPDWCLEKMLQHIHPEDRLLVSQAFDAAISGLDNLHFECRVIWPDCSEHWIAVHGNIYSAGGKMSRMTGIVLDITERKQAEVKVRHASLHDQLTGLPNRAMLFEYAGHLLPHNRRSSQIAAVLFLDLDRFKPINDSHGHETGDAVLKEVARRLRDSLRAEDIVVRLGGDEFLILLQDIREAPYAAEVARHIVDKINQPYPVGELSLSLSTSVGISIFPVDGQDIDTLISHADAAMYQAKQAGRNTYQFYSPALSAGTKQHLAIEQLLKSALYTSGFELYYQPVMDLQSGDIVSVEALLRWQNADIGPDRFIPVAEATGIINPIGRWVLREASRQHKAWLAQGLPAVPIAINVSAVEFRDREFVSRFKQLIGEYGINANVLQLELTETAVMDEIDHAVTVLAQLKALGATLVLDDFGLGHSSLACLARLPLDKIKIDKSFISRLDSDITSRLVTDSMLALGHTLDLDVVAEGIESAAVLDYLRSQGCQQAQGYLICKPVPGDAFASWYWQQPHASAGVMHKHGQRPMMPS